MLFEGKNLSESFGILLVPDALNQPGKEKA